MISQNHEALKISWNLILTSLDLCFVKFFIGLCAVVGHEISGVVSKVGPNVKDVHIGDHVGVGYFIDTCLNCEYCKNDQENNCVKGIVILD